jgi:copper chaperone NosL
VNLQNRHAELPGKPARQAPRRRSSGGGRLLLAPVLVALILTALLAVSSSAVEPTPRPGPEDRCPVCGMFVHKYPNWVSLIVFSDGTRVFFDGPKDLLRYYHELPKYTPDKTTEDIATIYVTDYYTTQLIDAREALFIVGSDVMGPMGKELVPVEGEEAAASFRQDHRGDRVLTFEDVELSELTSLQ